MGHSLAVLAPLLLLLLPGEAQTRIDLPERVGFPGEILSAHRIMGAEMLDLDIAEPGMEGVKVAVVVSPQGEVIDARARPAPYQKRIDTAPAVAAARLWKFRPFLYRGEPVTAVGQIEIGYRNKGGWAKPEAAFPAIDYQTLRITLVRGACFGSCPDYQVTIDGAGEVVFSTREDAPDPVSALHRRYAPTTGVLVGGVHRTKIDRATLDALVERFHAARFFGLRKEYFYGATDQSTQELRLSTGGHAMTVTDYIGEAAGMPYVVKELEEAVDAAAGTARWVRGDGGTVAALLADGLDIHSEDARQLALAATGSSEQVVLDLISAGLPLDATVLPRRAAAAEPLGALLLRGSIANRLPRLFATLAGEGWLAKMPRDTLNQLFASAAGGCDPAIARALVAAGADPNARSSESYGMSDPGGATALIAAAHSYTACPYGSDRKPIVTALLALGADPNAADAQGNTVLWGVEDPDLLEILLAAGARADVHNAAGMSPIFGSWSDVTVRRLLDAGADPKGHYDYNGSKTLREMAVEYDMPATLAWLDAHQVK